MLRSWNKTPERWRSVKYPRKCQTWQAALFLVVIIRRTLLSSLSSHHPSNLSCAITERMVYPNTSPDRSRVDILLCKSRTTDEISSGSLTTHRAVSRLLIMCHHTHLRLTTIRTSALVNPVGRDCIIDPPLQRAYTHHLGCASWSMDSSYCQLSRCYLLLLSRSRGSGCKRSYSSQCGIANPHGNYNFGSLFLYSSSRQGPWPLSFRRLLSTHAIHAITIST